MEKFKIRLAQLAGFYAISLWLSSLRRSLTYKKTRCGAVRLAVRYPFVSGLAMGEVLVGRLS